MIDCYEDEPDDAEGLFETLCDEARQADWSYATFMEILADHCLQRFADRVGRVTVH